MTKFVKLHPQAYSNLDENGKKKYKDNLFANILAKNSIVHVDKYVAKFPKLVNYVKSFPTLFSLIKKLQPR